MPVSEGPAWPHLPVEALELRVIFPKPFGGTVGPLACPGYPSIKYKQFCLFHPHTSWNYKMAGP